MANFISQSSQCELSDNSFRVITGRILVTSAAADADVKAHPVFNKDIIPYVFDGGQPSPADAGANLPLLGNGVNSVIGIVAYVEDAARLVKVELHPLTIADALLGGTLTAGVVTLADLGGAALSGVSTLKNLCFGMALNGLTLNAGAGTHAFNLSITYQLDLQV